MNKKFLQMHMVNISECKEFRLFREKKLRNSTVTVKKSFVLSSSHIDRQHLLFITVCVLL